MARVPSFSDNQLQAVCDVIGDTTGGLTGREIGQLLAQCQIGDPDPGVTKRRRLYTALTERQARDHCANNVMSFIMRVMDPVRWVTRHSEYEHIRSRLNQSLSFSGYLIQTDGQILQTDVAITLTQAEHRAGRLRIDLAERGVHPDVLHFCRAELLHDNYFHAVFEAAKSIADKIRKRTELTSDGSDLVDRAFGLGRSGTPLLAFNSLRNETERSEHIGLMSLIKGMFSAFRNTTAHAPKIHWSILEQDAKDILSLASLLHRRIDDAIRTPRAVT